MVLCHGQSWDATGWRDIAPRFVERGIPALALNFRGYDGSTGKTTYESVVADVAAAKAYLREEGAAQIALVGASMGGYAVLAASFEGDIECVVSLSSPVEALDDDLARRITGRKLFICADADSYGAAPHVAHTFAVASGPKMLVMHGGQEHSAGMFHAPYGESVIRTMLDFVATAT
ncbi:MAG TPA: alpha/beta fold hydrolase [Candidatus Limnocylindria bacterium]